MRSFGILHIFLLVFLLLSYLWSNAQDYVITSKGDTLHGQVKPLLYGPDKKVQVTDSEKKKTTLPMFQVRAFLYKDEIYQPVKGPDGYAFMKLVRSGYLSLFNYQLPNQVTYDGSFLIRRDGKGMDVPNIGFKKIMKAFLKDCQEVVDKIESGDLTKKELLKMIDEYNACINAKTINHEKVIAEKAEQEKIISSWDVLEEKVKTEADFEGKSNALEMIEDIKGKIAKGEKIPNFLLDGLKSSLSQDTFKVELENALKEIN